MSMSWDYVCKMCGAEFSTYHPDATHICGKCWSTKLTEAQRQRILPGAIPIVSAEVPKPDPILVIESTSNGVVVQIGTERLVLPTTDVAVIKDALVAAMAHQGKWTIPLHPFRSK